MKTRKLILFFSLFANLAFGQQQDFEKYIIKHKDWKKTENTQWEIHLKNNKGSLLYYGAEHLDDPAHAQFKAIKQRWDRFKPTVAFFEGPDRGIAANDTLTIQKFGESGYVRFLAKQAGVKTVGLEPSPVALYAYLCSKYPQQQVDLYLLSKEATRLRTRKELNKEQITVELNKIIAVSTKMLGKELAIQTIDQLAEVFKQQFGNTLAWWEAPSSWFDPRDTDENTSFTNKLATLSTEYRNIYMVGILAEYVNKGEKVFAVIGRNHVPLQEPALKYAIGL